jgi:hypothetical protein
MRISYLTVCVNYVDYLAVSYKHNKGLFDDYTVVTSPEDSATQAFCQKNGLGCVITDVFYQEGAAFNKGAGLNVGLAARLQSGHAFDWVAIMDADTFVPMDFRAHLVRAKLDKEWLYGCKRVLIPTWADYQTALGANGGWSQLKVPNGFGFGWFQLFNWDSAAIKGQPWGEWYPQSYDCTECDWKFFRLWGDLRDEYTRSIGRLAELPFCAFNLGPDGVNHTGRVAPQFSPSSL